MARGWRRVRIAVPVIPVECLGDKTRSDPTCNRRQHTLGSRTDLGSYGSRQALLGALGSFAWTCAPRAPHPHRAFRASITSVMLGPCCSTSAEISTGRRFHMRPLLSQADERDRLGYGRPHILLQEQPAPQAFLWHSSVAQSKFSSGVSLRRNGWGA
jgi:hypothetical protein